jgi:hypothetical protein
MSRRRALVSNIHNSGSATSHTTAYHVAHVSDVRGVEREIAVVLHTTAVRSATASDGLDEQST